MMDFGRWVSSTDWWAGVVFGTAVTLLLGIGVLVVQCVRIERVSDWSQRESNIHSQRGSDGSTV